MKNRGKKSRCTIAGHTLTWAELTVLNQLRDFLSSRKAFASSGIPLGQIFTDNAKLYCVRHLAEIGVLAACQIELQQDVVTVTGGRI